MGETVPPSEGTVEDGDTTADKEVQCQPGAKDIAMLLRIRQIGRTVASAASVGLVYLCVSSGLFSADLESSVDRNILPADAADFGTEGRLRRAAWWQVAALSSVLAVAGVGLVLAVCPDRFLDRFLAFCIRLRPATMNSQQMLSILLPVSLFMVVGPALMIVNKHIMQGIGFRYPLSLSLLGLLTCAISSHVAVKLGFATVRPESLEQVSGNAWYRTALPIGFCKAMTLATGNAVYLHLGLGFIQMLKAFTPVVVLVAMKVFGAATPSRSAVGFIWVIVAGTLVEVKGELHVTAVGLLLMLTTEVMEAISLVLTQKLLQNSKFTIVEGMYVLAPPGAACLLTASIALEWPRLFQEGDYQVVLERPLWFAFAAILGFLVNFTTFMVVQVTSSLTYKVLNTARCVGVVFIGMTYYGETVMPMEMAGYGVALAGFVGYNFCQMFPEWGEKLERSVTNRYHKSLPANTLPEDDLKE